MSKCGGKGYPGCDSCINRELDPFQCDSCVDESNWEGDGSEEGDFEEDTYEELSYAEFADLIRCDD